MFCHSFVIDNPIFVFVSIKLQIERIEFEYATSEFDSAEGLKYLVTKAQHDNDCC